MKNEPVQEPEVLRAVFGLLATFAVTVVAAFCLMLLLGAITRHHWFGIQIALPVLKYGPYIAMLWPGIGQLIRRRWLAGILLLLGGLVLASIAIFLAGGLFWMS